MAREGSEHTVGGTEGADGKHTDGADGRSRPEHTVGADGARELVWGEADGSHGKQRGEGASPHPDGPDRARILMWSKVGHVIRWCCAVLRRWMLTLSDVRDSGPVAAHVAALVADWIGPCSGRVAAFEADSDIDAQELYLLLQI